MTILVVGGKRPPSPPKGGTQKIEVQWHNGYLKRSDAKDQLTKLVQNADRVIIITGKCSHIGMWTVREAAKKSGVPVSFQRKLKSIKW